MKIIDTHCHIGLHKYEPLETLFFHMTRMSVDKAVFIQYMGNTDNGYMVESMNAFPGRFAAAMIVPADDDGSLIHTWAERGIGGIRLQAASRATAADPLAHWRTAAELGLVVSAPCSPQALLSAEFGEVVRTFPNLQIVIEHLAGANRAMQPPYEEFKAALVLAKYQNLTIKLPGFGEFCDLAPIFHEAMTEGEESLEHALSRRDPTIFDAIPPLADMALDAFGADRMMWGSDWPPVSSREGHANSLNVPLAWASTLSEAEQAAIFGGTAARVWNLATQ